MAKSSTPAANRPRKPRHIRRATPPMLWGTNQPVLKDNEEVETDPILPILPDPAFITQEQKNDNDTLASKCNPRAPSDNICVFPKEDLQEAFYNHDKPVKRSSSSQSRPVAWSRLFPRTASPIILPTYCCRMSELSQHQKVEGRQWLLRFLCFPPLLLILGHGLVDEFLQRQTLNQVTAFGDAERNWPCFSDMASSWPL